MKGLQEIKRHHRSQPPACSLLDPDWSSVGEAEPAAAPLAHLAGNQMGPLPLQQVPVGFMTSPSGPALPALI